MKKEWSWVDKKHRQRLSPNRWNKLVLIDDKDNKQHTGGRVTEEKGVSVITQLYFGVPKGVDYISICFTRIYDDGSPRDSTGYMDFKCPTTKRTFNITHKWLGTMTPDMMMIVEIKQPSLTIALGHKIYKGYS